VDLTKVLRLKPVDVLMLLISESGVDMSRWRNANAFLVAGLRPGHQISGGKRLRAATRPLSSQTSVRCYCDWRPCGGQNRHMEWPGLPAASEAHLGAPKDIHGPRTQTGLCHLSMLKSQEDFLGVDVAVYEMTRAR